MRLKEQVRRLFEQNRGSFISGEEIAGQLSVSRNAVWKAVKSLQSEGYNISAVTNKGYCLSAQTDILSQTGIVQYLQEDMRWLNITVLKEVTSTNTYLKELTASGAAEGSVVVSEQQTAGRGRLGRAFYSPDRTGLYMSLLLRPAMTAFDSVLLTTAAAVCVAEAIEIVSDKQAQIKWVNDIFIEGKKVSGILTEASFGMESGRLDYVIVGIGINVFAPGGGFPEEIGNIATAVLEQEQPNIRNRLAAEVLNRLLRRYQNLSDLEYVEEYKKRCFVLGREITVIEPNRQYRATAVDLDDRCRLKIRTEDGAESLLSSGEISIRF